MHRNIKNTNCIDFDIISYLFLKDTYFVYLFNSPGHVAITWRLSSSVVVVVRDVVVAVCKLLHFNRLC